MRFRYYFYLMVCLVAMPFLQGHRPDDHYPFIQYDKNRIQFALPGSMDGFFGKLRQLEKDQKSEVHILQLGDSHIQADISTDRIRQLFREDRRFPVHARGFVFPYKMANTNNPTNYQVEHTGDWDGELSSVNNHWCQWGIAAICAHTTNPQARFSINPNLDSSPYFTDRVRVFFPNTDPQSYRIKLQVEAGNSIEDEIHGDGFVEFVLEKPQGNLAFQLVKTEAIQQKFVLQGLTLGSSMGGLTMSASGVNGAKVTSYMRCADLPKNLKAIAPDLVIISLGTNDAYTADFKPVTFKNNLTYLINKVKAEVPEASILVVTPGDLYQRGANYQVYPNQRIPIAHNQIITTVRETGVSLWDFYEIMGGQHSAKQWRADKLYKTDYVHLTTKGYYLQGELMHKAMMDSYAIYAEKHP